MSKRLWLEELDLEEIPNLDQIALEELFLKGNLFQSLEGFPPTLKTLDISRNRIKSEEDLYYPFPALQTLNLSKNSLQIHDGNQFVLCFPSLQKLIAHDTKIKQTHFLQETEIEELDLKECPISCADHLPQTLKTLSIVECPLRMIQSRMPPHMESVVIRDCPLRFAGLPFRWGDSLQSLHLDYNNIERFPRNLPDTLKRLSLMGNRISHIPTLLPKQLTLLNLSRNTLREFPVFPPKRFTFLFLESNQLTKLPDQTVSIVLSLDNNWTTEEHHRAQVHIKQCWKRYVFTLRLRHYKRTRKTKEELFTISMMPERWQQVDVLDSVWFRKDPSRSRIDPHSG